MTINLPSNVEAVAQQQAAAIGMTVADYVVRLILDDETSALNDAELAISAAELDRAMEDVRAGRTTPAREALQSIADEFGLKARQ
jgi:hypothetical protein